MQEIIDSLEKDLASKPTCSFESAYNCGVESALVVVKREEGTITKRAQVRFYNGIIVGVVITALAFVAIVIFSGM